MSGKPVAISSPTETIECPLCAGAGKLKRTEVLDRLGMRDAARVAQLSAEETFRLLSQKHNHDQQNGWARFETELAKRIVEIREQHKDELRTAKGERDDLTRRVENCLREVAQLRERNHQLETEPTETIECPLCAGAGKLKRTEVLDRLGMRDAARVAQLSAEETFRLLSQKHNHDQQNGWARFETELAKRIVEIREQHKDELRTAKGERDDLTRRVENCLREVAQLRERNHQLETEMAKVVRVGKREEMDFRRGGADLGGHRRQREAS